jgi:hypothetical protein
MSENIDDEWESYLQDTRMGVDTSIVTEPPSVNDSSYIPIKLPKCEELYISTTTKVLYLNQEIDINNVFWKIPVNEYWRPEQGVIKKQMKIVSRTKEEYKSYTDKLSRLNYYTEHVIKSIDNPTARRNKFKDERKITIGVSKRDIMNCRGKVKNAFYNCFALILRFVYNEKFHEIHVKMFNTGKMEIPGIINEELLINAKQMIIELLSNILTTHVEFVDSEKESNVLINSNFNCGFYINRDKLYSMLRSKYNIESAFDPCSYPGVKCKFYYNNEIIDDDAQSGSVMIDDHSKKISELNDTSKYTEVSFMVFRTGSCLIVGNCSERVLRIVYAFIKKMLQFEYLDICVPNEITQQKPKVVKVRKKEITLCSVNYKKLLEER